MEHGISQIQCTVINHPGTPMFTEGRTYPVTHLCNRMYRLMDDKNRERHILIDKGVARFPLGTSGVSQMSLEYSARFVVVDQ